MLIKERIKDFDLSINFIEIIRDVVEDELVKRCATVLIEKMTELKEIFIESVTYREVD